MPPSLPHAFGVSLTGRSSTTTVSSTGSLELNSGDVVRGYRATNLNSGAAGVMTRLIRLSYGFVLIVGGHFFCPLLHLSWSSCPSADACCAAVTHSCFFPSSPPPENTQDLDQHGGGARGHRARLEGTQPRRRHRLCNGVRTGGC